MVTTNDQHAPIVIIPWRRPDTMDKQEENVRAIERIVQLVAQSAELWSLVNGILAPTKTPGELDAAATDGTHSTSIQLLPTFILLTATGGNIQGSASVISFTGTSVTLQSSGANLAVAGGRITATPASGNHVQLNPNLAGNVMVDVSNPTLSITGLPTVNPGPPAGQVWNNAGVLNIT